MNAVPETQADIFARELKEDAWAEVAHLPFKEAVRERIRRADQFFASSGLTLRVADPRALPESEPAEAKV